MAFYEHITEFAGKRVVDWEPGTPLGDPANAAYRLSLSWDEGDGGGRWTDKFARFLDDPAAARVTAIVVGPWEQDYDTKDEIVAGIIAALVGARDRLPLLERSSSARSSRRRTRFPGSSRAMLLPCSPPTRNLGTSPCAAGMACACRICDTTGWRR